jgi:hypothetical protein
MLGALVAGSSAVSGASPRYGVVTGSMGITGGVAMNPPGGTATSGRVVFKNQHGRELTIGVGKSGHFSVKLKPGVYTAFGGPPGWFPTCHGNNDRPFRVSADHTIRIDVACVAL